MDKGEKSWKVVSDLNLLLGCPLNDLSSIQERAVCVFLRNTTTLEHTSTIISPAGTKLHLCEHSDCSKSFDTNRKLRAHQKPHDEKPYTCSHPSCLSLPTLPFFSTWTKLQAPPVSGTQRQVFQPTERPRSALEDTRGEGARRAVGCWGRCDQ